MIIIITNKWTGNSFAYPIVYNSLELASKAINSIPYSKENYTFQIK